MTPTPSAIKLIEDLPLNARDSWYILLAYLGLKSGSWVQLRSDIWRIGDAPKRINQSSIATIESSLTKLGLSYHIEFRQTNAGIWQPDNSERERYNEIADIFVAKEKSILDDMLLARKNNDSTLLGLSLGYPKTAVEAFETQDKTFVSQLSPTVRLSEAGQLTFFTLSKDHWQNELHTVNEWIAAVKEHSGIMWVQLRRHVRLIDEELIELAIKSKQQ